MFGLFTGKTPAVRGDRAVATMERLNLGGLDQWVVIRGQDAHNPVLIYLHGGPGGSDYAPVRRWNAVLEEKFTLVHWCQRGANKSYSKSVPAESMTVEQFLADLHELVLHVTKRFGQEKVFIAGQSIGTVFGLLYAQRHPDLIHAYIGVNQVVDRAQEERISYTVTLETARRRGLTKAVAELEGLGAPEGGNYRNGLKGTLTQRQWMSKLGIVSHDPKRIMQWQKAMIFAPELSWAERLRLFKGVMWSMERLWPELCTINFLESLQWVQVPVYFVAGRQDHITSLELTERLANQLRAPNKQVLVLENAGHLALFEQPERFNAFMVDVVRKNAM